MSLNPRPVPILVRASGTPADGEAPHFVVLVDGVRIGEGWAGAEPADHAFRARLAPGQPHTVAVVYDNDATVAGQDRNLLLESVAVGGRTARADGPLAVYHADGQGDLRGTGGMWWGGTTEFALPADWLAPATPGLARPRAFHVAPGGDDRADGSAARPFATLERALDATEGSAVKTICLRGGTYQLDRTVVLGAEHSGVTLKAVRGEFVTLDGASRLDTLIELDGASGVTIRGLNFVNAASGGGALSLLNADDNRVIANRFDDNGTAILLTSSDRNTVSGNRIEDSAQSAVEAKDGSDGNLFDSNWIDRVGGLETQGGGFFLHGANANVISHNVVENTQGMGIGVANWDATTINVGNVIQYNVVRNANIASYDSGSIYVLGRSHVDTQTTIAFNFVDGTGPAGRHTIGIYLDDSTSGARVEGNIVRDVGRHAVQVHGGDDNRIAGNVLDIGSGIASAVLFQAGPADQNSRNTQLGNEVTGNIIYSSSAQPVIYDWLDGGAPEIRGNLYWNSRGAPMTTREPTLDTAPHHGDPRFADAAAGDYALGAGSAAAAIGFAPIDQSLIGLSPSTAAWWLVH